MKYAKYYFSHTFFDCFGPITVGTCFNYTDMERVTKIKRFILLINTIKEFIDV